MLVGHCMEQCWTHRLALECDLGYSLNIRLHTSPHDVTQDTANS